MKPHSDHFVCNNYISSPTELMTKPKNFRFIILFIGALFMASSQIVSHYVNVPDFWNGLMLGTGIGLMLIGLKRKNKSEVAPKS